MFKYWIKFVTLDSSIRKISEVLTILKIYKYWRKIGKCFVINLSSSINDNIAITSIKYKGKDGPLMVDWTIYRNNGVFD